jgi:hypothetical protein
MRETAKVTDAEPGSTWTVRALRAAPRLAHVRIESHRLVTDRMVEAYAPLLPDVPRDVLWRRLRISVELGYAIDEMLPEEDRLDRDDVFRDAARVLSKALLP